MGSFPFTATGGLPSLPLVVSNGGTGDASMTAFGILAGGTTATSPVQVISPAANGQALIATGTTSLAAFGGALAPTTNALTDAATTAINADLGNYFVWLLTSAVGASRTAGAPSNAVSGALMYISIQQPASGGPCTVSWTSGVNGYSFGASGAPTLSTAANAVDVIAFRFSALLVKWIYQGSQLGFS